MSEDSQKSNAEAYPAGNRVLKGLALPIVALVLAAGVAIAYFSGALADEQIAEMIALAFVLILFGFAVKAGFESRHGLMRLAVVAYALLFFLVGLYPATVELMPGKPVVEGQLSENQRTLALPLPGSYRLLVSSPLKQGGDARLAYKIRAGESSLEGALERVYSYRRVRRGNAMRISEDHDVESHDLKAEGNPPTLTLDSMSGESTGSALTVRAFRVVSPLAIHGAMALLLLLGMFLEAKIAARGALTMTGATAVCFGLLITSASPGSVLGPVLGSVLLGAGGGALGGSLLAAVGRKLFKAPERAKKGRAPDLRPIPS
jgi:hypothetical protein